MPEPACNNQRGIVLLTAILVLTFILVVGGALFYISRQSAGNLDQSQPTSSTDQTLKEVPAEASRSSPTPSPATTVSNTTQLKNELLLAIDQKISTLSAKTTGSAPKELYVYFGLTGSSHSSDWETVAGSEIKFDPGLYPGAKAFYFQASLQSDAPDREVFGRIYDLTHSTPIQSSDINFTGLTATFQQSSPMYIAPGSASLVVQLHSQNLLGNVATIYNPRIKISY